MKLIALLFLLLLPTIFTAPYPSTDDRRPVSFAEISRLLAEGDDREQLAAYLGNRILEYAPNVAEQLQAAIRLHRPESFRCLFHHSRFLVAHRYNYNQHMANFLGLAVWEHQPEICEYLLGVGFQVDGHATSFWSREPFLWTIAELVDLVRRHPRFAAFTAPRRGSVASAPSFESATRMLDFVEQLRAFDNGFLGNGHHHPTALLQGLAENEELTDAEMTVLFDRLLQMGAEVDIGIITGFAHLHPGHVMAYQALLAASQEPDIKEPAER